MLRNDECKRMYPGEVIGIVPKDSRVIESHQLLLLVQDERSYYWNLVGLATLRLPASIRSYECSDDYLEYMTFIRWVGSIWSPSQWDFLFFGQLADLMNINITLPDPKSDEQAERDALVRAGLVDDDRHNTPNEAIATAAEMPF